MKHYQSFITNQFGKPLASVNIQVNIAGGAAASLFSNDGLTSKGNPVATDAAGFYDFYVADGLYDLVISGTGVTTITMLSESIFDATGNTSVADAVWKVNVLNAITGLQLNGAATTGNVLRGNGTNFVSAALNYSDLAGSITVPGTGIVFNGSTSGTATVKANAVAGAGVLTLPTGTDTLIAKASTDTLTNKTFDSAGTGNVLKVNGTSLTAVTGTGSVVLATSPAIATAALTSPTVSSGLTNSGTGVKHVRTSTGSVAAAARALVTITWPGTAFADANYTLVVSVQDGSTGAGLSLRIEHIQSSTTTGCTVSVVNDAAGPLTGTIHAVAFHD